MNNDYSQIEIDNIIDDILDSHYSKLMSWEINNLEKLKHIKPLGQDKRDWLISLYDRIGESGY